MFWYLISSIFTFVIYAWDKYQAKRHGWRIPENNLHLLSVCGGWLGALIAQHFLQHKTSKISFRRIYWLTIIINMIGLIAWHTKQAQQMITSFF